MHSENEIIASVKTGINGKIEEFYKNEILNYSGKTSDTKELYSEVIAEELLKLDIKNKIKNIKEITRQNSYHVKSHDGQVTTNHSKCNSNRTEEWFALELFNESKQGRIFNKLGSIIDYQVPLKNKRDDNAGKIDLISKDEKNIYLIELKIKESKETLLRCILEITTYFQLLDKNKFLSDYKEDKDIKKAVLIVKDSPQEEELKSINNGERNYLKQLMSDLDVQVFVINEGSMEVL